MILGHMIGCIIESGQATAKPHRVPTQRATAFRTGAIPLFAGSILFGGLGQFKDRDIR